MRLGVWLIVIAVAYGVAWSSDAALGDPCVEAGGETDSVDYVQRWLPPRTDCRGTTTGGGTHVEKGSAEVSITMFALTLVLAAALLARGASLALRGAAALSASAVAFLVVFVW
jgi:hypothetical protein